ncbi:MAG: diacylglycerol kinase family protein [Oscillospiraceae bacterium]|nr:diacylglycerol kinase family protein [Oscillospiraceae bacterium]
MKRGIKSFIASFANAFRGIAAAIGGERNFRVHICMMIYVIFFSVIGEVGRAEVSRFVLCFGIVLSAELINTAIENLCDAVTEEYNLNIRKAKDVAAGAVLVSAVAAAVVGLSVFLSPDVFCLVMEKFAEMPWLLVSFLISVPIAILFIIKRGKR